MLKPKVLHNVLLQACTNGVKATLLMNEDGSLLAGSGKDINIISAIFANIWASYEKCGNLEYYMEELEEGKILMTKVTNNFILLIQGDRTTEYGMLLLKLKKLKEYLVEPLTEITKEIY